MTACAVMMAYFFKQAPSAPAQLERALAHPINWKKISSIFNFVLFEMKGEPMTVDSRWDMERKIVLVDQTRISLGGSGAPIENLREMLSQMGFQLNIPDLSQVNQALSVLREEKVRIERGTLNSFGLPKRYSLDNSPQTISFDGENYILEIYPANAKPNLNYVDQEDLERYLEWLGLDNRNAERLSQLLVDFHDEDSSALAGNTEGPFQFDNRYIARFPNRTLQRFDELAYIPGIDTAMIDFLRRHFTIYGTDGRINYKYNTPESIAAYTELRAEEVSAALSYEKQKNDPLYNQTLVGLIGTDAAKKWNEKVADSAAQDQPVHVILKGKKIELHADYLPERKKILDVYIQ